MTMPASVPGTAYEHLPVPPLPAPAYTCLGNHNGTLGCSGDYHTPQCWTANTYTQPPAAPVQTGVQIEVVGTLTPTELVRSLLKDTDTARHVYALLGAVLTNEGHIKPTVSRDKPSRYVSPAEKDEAMKARRTLGTEARQKYLMGMTIRIWRINAHMERKALAEAAGISYPFLAGIETGQRGMSIATLEAIADALNTTPTALMAEADGLGMPA